MGFDLSTLAPALGGALRGYTGGLAAGEQAKLNLLQQNYRDMFQQQQFDAEQKYRQEMLDYRKQALVTALMKSRGGSSKDPFQDALAKMAGASLSDLFANPDKLKAMGPGAIPHVSSLLSILHNGGSFGVATGDPLAEDMAAHLMGFMKAHAADPIGGLGGDPEASAPITRVATGPAPQLQTPPAHFGYQAPALIGIGNDISNVHGGEAAGPSIVPPPPPVPSLTPNAPRYTAAPPMADGPIPFDFSPEYMARVAATMAQGADALAGADLKTAQTPQVAPNAKSHRELEAKQGALAGVEADAIPKKVIETNRHALAAEAIDKFKALADRVRANADARNAATKAGLAPSERARNDAEAQHLKAMSKEVLGKLDPKTAAYLKGIGPIWKKGFLGDEFSEEAAQAWEKALHLPPGTVPRPGAVAPTAAPTSSQAPTMSTPVGTMSAADLQAQLKGLQTGQGTPAGPAAANPSNVPNPSASANPTKTARANAAKTQGTPVLPPSAKTNAQGTGTASKAATAAPIQDDQQARKMAAQIKVLKQKQNELQTALEMERAFHGTIRAQDRAKAEHYQQSLQHEINTLSQRLNDYMQGPSSYPGLGGGAPDSYNPATYGITPLHPALQPPPIAMKKKK